MNTQNPSSSALSENDLDPIAVLEVAEPLAPRAAVSPTSPTFAELGARPETVEALAAVGIVHSFAIQEYALPIGIRGTDMIGQAPTGTGKTLGFGIPLLERVTAPSEGADGRPQALVVVPTRELGIQVARDIKTAGGTRGIRVMAIYGGVAYEPQTDALTKGVEIIVGTPGRLLDLAKGKQLNLSGIKALVLDEADRMLDLGFLDDVEKILAMSRVTGRPCCSRPRCPIRSSRWPAASCATRSRCTPATAPRPARRRRRSRSSTGRTRSTSWRSSPGSCRPKAVA